MRLRDFRNLSAAVACSLVPWLGLADDAAAGRGCVDYTITIKTGDRSGAGTDSNIRLYLMGVDRDGEQKTMEFRTNLFISGNAFERNDTDSFDVCLWDMGIPLTAYVHSDGKYAGSDWYLDWVRLESPDIPRTNTTFRFDEWVEEGYAFSYCPRCRMDFWRRTIWYKPGNTWIRPVSGGWVTSRGQPARPY